MIEKRSIPKAFKGFILKIVLLILLSYIEAKKTDKLATSIDGKRP